MKWASWVNFILGLWLIVAPSAMHYGYVGAGPARGNDIIVGIVVAVFALWSALAATRGPSWVVLLFGLWLIVSPWVLGYHMLSSALANNVVTGIVVAVLAALRLATAQSYNRTVA
jgi:hypothetical protein